MAAMKKKTRNSKIRSIDLRMWIIPIYYRKYRLNED
jgi:hypothetical protein